MIDRALLTTAIDGFSVDTAAYRRLTGDAIGANGITLEGPADRVEVFVRDGLRDLALTIAVPERGRARVFLGNDLAGTLRLALRGDRATVYIGDNGRFAGLELRCRQADDLIAIGNDVAVTGPSTWVSGLEAAPGCPSLVIGDCCLIASGVTLRNSDGHPVMDRDTGAIVNVPGSGILIEPHAWLGERSAVLKDVTVGAFARIAFGSVVTRDVPRYAVAQGIPAKSEVRADRYWAWDASETGRARAEHFLARFPARD